jgi:transcriptional regulator GlxA family with amidase domain
MKDVIDTLQICIGILDAPDGAGPAEGESESRLLNQIVQLGPAEQGLIVAVVAQLLVKQRRLENPAAADQVRELLSARAGDGPTTERHVRALVSLLSHVKRRDDVPQSTSNARNASQAERVMMAMRFLEANASGPVDLDKVAKHVGWTKWHLARVFKRHTGSGIAEFWRRVRVDRARRLLAERKLTVKEVAAAAGFTRPSDLTRCFLQAYGISPSRFRSAPPLADSS